MSGDAGVVDAAARWWMDVVEVPGGCVSGRWRAKELEAAMRRSGRVVVPAWTVVVTIAVMVAASCAPTSPTSGASTTSTVGEPVLVELDEIRVAVATAGRLLDVEHGRVGDLFYTLTDHPGVVHVMADGVTETIGESLWPGRLNAFVGYRQVAVSRDGTLYVADTTTRRVWRVEPQHQPDGQLVYSAATPEVVAGRGKDCYQSVLELYPQTYGQHVEVVGGACYEYDGWLLDNPDLARNVEQGVVDDGAVAAEAIVAPWNIEVSDDETKLVIADIGAGQGPGVRVVDLQAGTISTEAAWVPGDNGTCDHPALAEGRAAVSEQDLWGTYRMPFCQVFDVGFGPSGAIVFAAGSYTSGAAAGGVLTTQGAPGAKTLHVLAGCAGSSCSAAAGVDPRSTSLSDMPALDVRRDGVVVVADTFNHRVLELTSDATLLLAVAGSGRRCSASGSCPTDAAAPAGDPLSTDLDLPREVSVGRGGTLLLAEDDCSFGADHWLRRID
jgi:hypothetical protein